jgi:hypothetical protein
MPKDPVPACTAVSKFSVITIPNVLTFCTRSASGLNFGPLDDMPKDFTEKLWSPAATCSLKSSVIMDIMLGWLIELPAGVLVLDCRTGPTTSPDVAIVKLPAVFVFGSG